MKHALIVGAGPAGLMAAETLSAAGLRVTLCDALPSAGRKFLMAGKSGLNLTMDEPLAQFLTNYRESTDWLSPFVEEFDASAVRDWAQGLDQEIFTGSTGRVFPRAMKASPLLRAWLARLAANGVLLRTRMRWQGWDDNGNALFDTPSGSESVTADVTVLALGGNSWSKLGADGRWAAILERRGVQTAPFAPSNAGLAVDWTDHMRGHFGAALKSVRWSAGAQTSRGEAVLSARGLEGGGIYTLSPALRQGAALRIDLVPDLTPEQLTGPKAPARGRTLSHWMKSTLRLSPVKAALVFEMAGGQRADPQNWASLIKELPVRHNGFLPADEAISTVGGVSRAAVTGDLMLSAVPGVFCAGEMLDWDAPTGGYLITACLATGRHAGLGALRYLAAAA
ncbi:TIGR03862 family flavoprotein [uncultured Roseobacter sp.]|uniref:TIGR03862 family flavoprotein n=1 Tax=uncultured Roseobacter sp. TaxID=114847 RepID=UPI002639A0E0|nr:TIGR03862 family flavoprotein [uncultured Roseobacter sp.]